MMDVTTGVANRMLERESWARQRLAAHAGRSFVVVSPPLVTAFRIDPTGLLEPYALADGAPDLRLVVQPWSVPGLLAEPARWDQLVTSEGDAMLAATLRELAQTVPFWIEQILSRWLGAIAGPRIAHAGRRLLGVPEYAAERAAETVGSYMRDETGLLATGEEGRMFADQVASLGRSVEALGERLDRLAATTPALAR